MLGFVDGKILLVEVKNLGFSQEVLYSESH